MSRGHWNGIKRFYLRHRSFCWLSEWNAEWRGIWKSPNRFLFSKFSKIFRCLLIRFLFFPGVLSDIQDSFQIKDDQGGLLQTVFILSYMIFAPIFGYLGDRFSRKAIMAFGITLWGATTLLGSFMNHFGWFIAFRALVGIGEASYSTIAPTILSDLFVRDLRSKMLAVFYFAIPVGSGLGWVAMQIDFRIAF